MAIKRIGALERTTKETQISAEISLDGTGRVELDTGVPFLDHMLTLFAVHGLFDLKIKATGDLEVDAHHTVEDIGICLGMALSKALGDRAGITRYGHFAVPMDEALAMVSLDLSNRPFLVYDTPPMADRTGEFETDLAPRVLQGFLPKWRSHPARPGFVRQQHASHARGGFQGICPRAEHGRSIRSAQERNTFIQRGALVLSNRSVQSSVGRARLYCARFSELL